MDSKRAEKNRVHPWLRVSPPPPLGLPRARGDEQLATWASLKKRHPSSRALLIVGWEESDVGKKKAVIQKLKPMIVAADASVFLLDLRCCGFAETVDGGSTQFVQQVARKYDMVIVSPILKSEVNRGKLFGILVPQFETMDHIPRVGVFNEGTYHMEWNTGHPAFETAFGKIGVNIFYGRHHLVNWLVFGLNRAEIVFNPSVTAELSEPLTVKDGLQPHSP